MAAVHISPFAGGLALKAYNEEDWRGKRSRTQWYSKNAATNYQTKRKGKGEDAMYTEGDRWSVILVFWCKVSESSTANFRGIIQN